jgi:hypothetical protein
MYNPSIGGNTGYSSASVLLVRIWYRRAAAAVQKPVTGA